MLNKVILIGNVGVDVATSTTQAGTKIAKFSLATSEKRKDAVGSTVEQTEWHNIVMFNKLAELAEKYVKKGDKLYIEGKIQTNKYEQNGETKFFTSIIANQMNFLGGAKKTETPEPVAPVDNPQAQQDDLPF